MRDFMKNVINFYYNLYPENIFQTMRGYYFFIGKWRYFFVQYLDDIDEVKQIYDRHLYLLNNNIYVHHIIVNKDGNVLTFIDGKYYVLMLTVYYDKKISFDDVAFFSSKIIFSDMVINNGSIWALKNDSLEYQVNMLGYNYPLMRGSFSYFLAFGETAIQLFNSIEKNAFLSFSHKRVEYLEDSYDFYNPFNILIDYRVRDVVEYLKSKFFSGLDIFDDMVNYFNKNNLSYDEYLIFLARMLYPTYYFDLIEEIIKGKKKDDDLSGLINRAYEYEKLMKKLYRFYKTFLSIPTIEWLEY